ncbi:MAG: sulfatase family protein [Rubripirellula sp.]
MSPLPTSTLNCLDHCGRLAPLLAIVIFVSQHSLLRADDDQHSLLRADEEKAIDSDNRPNILLIVSEDNGQELGCYGDPYVSTPRLDELADQGVRFHNAYVPQAGCSQSRAAYFTGLYPHQNGQIGLATWKYRLYDPQTPNLVRSLHDVGYRTAILGKLHVNPASAFPFDSHQIKTANFSRKGLNEYASKAAKVFQSSDRPFFLCVNYPDAHRPFLDQIDGLPKRILSGDDITPLKYFGLDTAELRSDTAAYYNCMQRLDSLVGDLLDALESSGQADKTIVIYLGDHGADLLRGKRTSYEGGLRVPLIIRWPGRTSEGLVRQELVSSLDLYPTLLEITKLDSPGKLAGRSLLPLLHSSTPDWREYLFTEYHLHSAHNFFPQRTVRDARYKLIQNLLPEQVNPGYAFTEQRFFEGLSAVIERSSDPVRQAYQRMRKPPEFELYDLENDPHEFENLASNREHRETLTRLQTTLASWRDQTNDPLLDPRNLEQLKAEIDDCFVDGKPNKQHLELNYPEYFFESTSPPKRSED